MLSSFFLAAAEDGADAGKAIALALGIGLGSLGAGIGIGNIFGTMFGPSFGLLPSTPAMKPMQNHPFSSSPKRPKSFMA